MDGDIQIVISSMGCTAVKQHALKLKNQVQELRQEVDDRESGIIQQQATIRKLRRSIAETEVIIAKLEA